MKKILEGVKFGDKFMTRDGKKAIVINLTPHFQGITIALTIEGDKDAFYRFYHEDGIAKKEVGDTDAVDIVYKWEEPVDEEKLDKFAQSAYPLEDDSHWNRYQCERQEAYKAGYRKAKDE